MQLQGVLDLQVDALLFRKLAFQLRGETKKIDRFALGIRAGGGALVADRLTQLAGTEVALLAQVPISVGLREGSDTGLPIIISNPDDPASQAITQIANALKSGISDILGVV